MSELAIELRLIGREILHERYIDAVVVPLTLAHAADRIEALEAALRKISKLYGNYGYAKDIARAALAPEREK